MVSELKEKLPKSILSIIKLTHYQNMKKVQDPSKYKFVFHYEMWRKEKESKWGWGLLKYKTKQNKNLNKLSFNLK